MSLKIFHTGDLHLGKRFNSYKDTIMEELVEARYESLENMINISNDLNTDIFVIAGDLFNTIQVSKKDVKRTVEILERYNGGCLLVLPGNHDYDDGLVELWKEFSRHIEDKILLINEEKIYNLKSYGLDAYIYPAPCHSKHSSENNLTWIKDLKEISKKNDSSYHIGVAHGALEGLSADLEGRYYYMGMDELLNLNMDLWLVGHTHVRYPLESSVYGHRIFNAGTHEPDGINFNREGSAWLIDLDGEEVRAEAISTGKYRFYDKKLEIRNDKDLLKLVEKPILKGNPRRKIIRLELCGNLSREAYENLNKFYENLYSQVLYLDIEDSKLRPRVDKEKIEEEFTRGSLPYEFLMKLVDDGEALQLAYNLIRGYEE